MPQRPIIGSEIQSLAADGNTTAVKFDGGKGTLTVYGTFGGGTVKLQRSIDNVTYIDVVDATLTANGQINFEFGACYVRANLAGATAPDLSVSVAGYCE